MHNEVVVGTSTISGNQADDVGGLFAVDADGIPSQILKSALSGNSAGRYGDLLVLGTGLAVYNSTIAFNTAAQTGGGALGGDSTIVSSIIANNTQASQPSDIGRASSAPAANAIAGDSNLIHSSTLTLPADTIALDPMLAPLADNGGITLTHALLDGSPAIDRGDNFKHYPIDQRGLPRVAGAGPDIGAHEFGAMFDEIFGDGFDGLVDAAPMSHAQHDAYR